MVKRKNKPNPAANINIREWRERQQRLEILRQLMREHQQEMRRLRTLIGLTPQA